jgi:hypothetical protein
VRRVRVALLMLVVLVAGCSSPSAPRAGAENATDATATPAHPPPPPKEGATTLALGDTWTYEVTSRNTTRTQTATVTEVSERSAFVETQGERKLRTEFDLRTLAIRSASQSDGAVGGSIAFDPPLGIVIPAADHEWYGAATLRTPLGASSRPAHAQVTFLGFERIEVPAGEVACYHYSVDLTSEGSPPFAQKLDIWYAPDVKAYAKQVSGNETQVLVSYHVA